MKILSIFSVSLFSYILLFSSCSKETSDKIYGSWNVVNAEIKNCQSPSNNEPVVIYSSSPCIPVTHVNCQFQEFTFGSSGTLSEVFTSTNEDGDLVNDDNNAGTFTVADDNAILCIENECYNFKIEFDGNDKMRLQGSIGGEEGCETVWNLEKN